MSSTPVVRVVAPSRLHFGLFSFGLTEGRQFGGVGVMIAEPRTVVEGHASDQFRCSGPMCERVEEYAERWARFEGLTERPRFHLEVLRIPRSHTGLGVGTQLGLAVAACLNELHGRESNDASRLAQSVERGLRSAVGTYGFVHGGLIAEQGKTPQEKISPLWQRQSFPEDWRFLVINPEREVGLHGDSENSAFQHMPPVPPAHTARMIEEAEHRLLPALERHDFDKFGESLYQLGRLSGECFRTIQGGIYLTPELEQLVTKIRDLGIAGVGQSSWGPSLFALLPGQDDAERLLEQLDAAPLVRRSQTYISPVDNRGAQVSRAVSSV